jgi:hypothetical protein
MGPRIFGVLEEKVSFEEKRTLDLISFMRLDVDVAAENIVQCAVL